MTPVKEKTTNVVVTPGSVDVEPGDTLHFTNNSTQFPKFEIEFQGLSPAKSGKTLFEGTNKIEVHVENDGIFEYTIKHITQRGHCVCTRDFHVRSCNGGCPPI